MEAHVSPSAITVILLMIATTSTLIMLSLNQINYIVHGDLYAFDLKFSTEWAMPYWTLSGIIFGLSWTNIALSIIFTVYVQKKSRGKPKPTLTSQTEKTEAPAQETAKSHQGSDVGGEPQPEAQVGNMTEKTLVARTPRGQGTSNAPRGSAPQEKRNHSAKAPSDEE